jgi:DNA topoisomerase-2
MHIKPAKKKKATQAEVTDFFEAAGSGAGKPTARKVSKPTLIKKVESDDDIDFDDLPPPPARSSAPKRAARATKKYIEVTSEDGEDDLYADDD